MQDEVEMAPEQPPRRSRKAPQPVTIDLTAEPSDVVAEPVRSNDADEATPVEPLTVTEQAVTASGNTEEPARADRSDEPAAAPTAEEHSVPSPDAGFVNSAPADAASEEAQPRPQPEPATVAPEPEPMPSPRHRSAPAASTLIASGIFGGLVALLLAGSMQYAGLLPGSRPAPAADTSGLSSELAELRQEIATLKERPAAAIDTTLADRIAALETASRTPNETTERSLAAIQADMERLRSTVQSAAGNDSTLARRLDEAEAKLNDSGPEQQAARAIAAAALKAAIDRGGAFGTELRTFATVAGDDPAVSDLEKFAATGVPSRAELQREFSAVADAILEAVDQPDPDQGIAGRLLASAMSVVKVRRVGDVAGDAPEAAVARVEEGLRTGDLQASAREWEKLPEPAKAVAGGFKRKLDARIQVENLVGGTLTRAVTGTQG